MPRPLAQLTRRVDDPRRGPMLVTLDAHAITFREPGHRFTLALPYPVALARAERLAGDAAYLARKRKR
jgi:hypothetical protein